eukprot:CAMPEP_0119559814 /NCGR_PEP_ID=MMETSP1352-20130426/13382_1 /TAXON_ID=265584 /ORGANISM="Stauroneis constricta, Strain CCMP1120" /LENGTH=417 /DNA_ID=CAMNT_0007607611 /DNA_START=313 /DNA_END=1564 /DNA_ORIENTATION=-
MSQSSTNHFPDDITLRRMLRELVPTVDIRTTGIKTFTKLLAKYVTNELQYNENNDKIEITYAQLKTKSNFIRDELTIVINELAGESENDDGDDDDDGDDGDEHVESDDDDDDEDNDFDYDESTTTTAKPTKAKAKTKGKAAPKRKKNTNRAKSTQKGISKQMAKFLKKIDVVEFPSSQTEKNIQIPRTEIVKGLWSYIRDNNLQNPKNRQEIILDKKMQKLFGVEKFTMFTMNRYVSTHIEPFPSIEEVEEVAKKKAAIAKAKREEKNGGKTKKRKRKVASSTSSTSTPAKKKPAVAAAAAAASSSPTKKKRKGMKEGSQPPFRLSEDMAAVVGTDILPRPQVIAKIWVYIRRHGLQNPENKKEIICDKKLRRIMDGAKTITMFTMNKHITPHLVERVDRSEYVHEPDDYDNDDSIE